MNKWKCKYCGNTSFFVKETNELVNCEFNEYGEIIKSEVATGDYKFTCKDCGATDEYLYEIADYQG